MKQKNLVIAVLLVVVSSGVGFFAGTAYQSAKTPSVGTNRQFMMGGQAGEFRQNQNGNNTGNRTGGRGVGFRPVVGEILKVDGKTITVKLADDSTKIIVISDTTSLNKASIATSSDLKVGEKVSVFGQEGTDGTVSAQNIQLNPITANQPASQ